MDGPCCRALLQGQLKMLKGSAFYRDNRKLICMGHPDCRRPCSYEQDEHILRAAQKSLRAGAMTGEDFRCIELDTEGFPGKTIIGYIGQDPTGAHSKRARYACERAYAKIGRRLCMLCSLLWAADRPKGPRRCGQDLKYPREEFKAVRAAQGAASPRVRRRKGTVSLKDYDRV